MRGSRSRWALGAILALLALLVASAGVAEAGTFPGPDFTRKIVAGGLVTHEENPQADGEWVVYERRRAIGLLGETLNWDLRAYSFKTGVSLSLTDNDWNQTSPDVWGDHVVCEDDREGNKEIYLYDLATGLEAGQLTYSGTEKTSPRIGGPLVVWRDSSTGSLGYFHLVDGTNGVVPGSAGAILHDVDQDWIVFTTSEATGDKLHVFRYGGYVAQQIHDAGMRTDITSLRIHGDTIAFTESDLNDNVYLMDRRTGNATLVPFETDSSLSADVFHGKTAFVDYGQGFNEVVWGDTTAPWTAFATPTTVDPGPSVFGHRVAWEVDDSYHDIEVGTATPEITRTYGADRYLTAVETSKAYFSSSAKVVMCTGEKFPDALAAAPWAHRLDAPLLLSRADHVPDEVLDELERLNATTVFLVGGTTAIMDTVKATLQNGGYTVYRQFAGVDRYDTARKIALALNDSILTTTMRAPRPEAYFVNGKSYADALSVAAPAAAYEIPILLVERDSVPIATREAITALGTHYGVSVGGEAVISETTKEAIDDQIIGQGGHPTEHWWGDDRFQTSAYVASRCLDLGLLDLDTLAVATGRNYPDALGAGTAMGQYGSPLLLVDTDTLPASTSQFLNTYGARVGRLDVFGGPVAVSDAVLNSISDRLK